MYCSKCGEKNSEEAEFCAKCGAKIAGGVSSPDKQAAKEAVREMIKEEVGGIFSEKTVKEIKNCWQKFSMDEKIMAIGAAAALAGFFLPWVESSYSSETFNGIGMAKEATKWFYIFLAIPLVSLFLLFLGRNKVAVRKALSFQWQIVLSTFISSVGLIIIFTLEEAAFFPGDLGAGWWMITFGGIAILIGALRAQKYFLRNITIK